MMTKQVAPFNDPIKTLPPKDGRVLILLMKHPGYGIFRSIGFNNAESTGADFWQCPSWSGSGEYGIDDSPGEVIGWLPMPDMPDTTLL
jgi:hypothetical protein